VQLAQAKPAARAAQDKEPGPRPGGASAADKNPVQLGVNASFGGRRLFPDDNVWNTPIDHLPVDSMSSQYIATIGADKGIHPDFGHMFEGREIGIPYIVIPGSHPRYPVKFDYADESDHELYPIPPNPPIEGGKNPPPGSDLHLLIVDRDNWRLYELFGARKQGNQWLAGSGAIYDLNSNALRPAGWTSADAAGLPILPALVKYEEVAVLKEIRHALRFTVRNTRRAYTFPARHFASRKQEPNLPPMGMRVRLRADYDISGFSPANRVILKAMKKYGMILADNGGDWFFTGVPDPRWNVAELADLKRVKGKDLEVVQMGTIMAG
jgi:hypothetical protein